MINDVVLNDLVLRDGVWTLAKSFEFKYSDGEGYEKTIRNVLENASDLSSDSIELDAECKDWTSTYHLSSSRKALIEALVFDANSDVLEVGCGCGAITRYLGERFTSVVAIEGGAARADLARRRTRGQDNVHIINAPFQDVIFKKKFDLIFCIGVLEYSRMFVASENPYKKMLSIFRNLLHENGVLVVAIENQFGLKYFSSSKEDHTHQMFDGIEGYRRMRNSARTFGLGELEGLIRSEFEYVEAIFPFPDYKFPSCIVRKEALNELDCSELISYHYRDKIGNPATRMPIFNDQFVLAELSRNQLIDVFANSFLFLASPEELTDKGLTELGVFFNNDRKKHLRTKTVLVKDREGYFVKKSLLNQNRSQRTENFELSGVISDWHQGKSLNFILIALMQADRLDLNLFNQYVLRWLSRIKLESYCKADQYFVPGKFIDAIFRNVIVEDEKLHLIDQEWRFKSDVQIETLFIRAIWHFISELMILGSFRHLGLIGTKKSFIVRLAHVCGLELRDEHWERFFIIERLFHEETRLLNAGITRLSFSDASWPIIVFALKSIMGKYIRELIQSSKDVVSRLRSW